MTRSLTLELPAISTGPKCATGPGSAVNTMVAAFPEAPSCSAVETFA
ncbi:MAG: hypothetical protein U0Q55_06865 [Vicinamibacterales bacterium]